MRIDDRNCARDQRRGVVTPWVALSLTVIVGVVAFGLDGGRLLEERRSVQATADAAALAGAAQLYRDYRIGQGKDTKDQAKTAAEQAAAANGYDKMGAASTVTVNIPPLSGAFAGKNDYVEVLVESKLAASFSRLFTGEPLKVQARSVARGRPVRLGIITLASSGPDALVNDASGTFTVVNAPIIVNSSDSRAMRQNSALPMIAESFQIVGNYVNSSGGLIVGAIETGAEPIADPLRNLPAPTVSAAATQSSSTLHLSTSLLPKILEPGVYKGGIKLSGQAVVTMKPGVYIMDGGGLSISGNAALTGLGVMIYNTSVTQPAGPLSLTGNGVLALTPPLSGVYQGVSVFQDRGVPLQVQLSANGAAAIVGVIYAPAAPVALSGKAVLGTDVLGGAVIARTLSVSGFGSVAINLGLNHPLVPDVTLVE